MKLKKCLKEIGNPSLAQCSNIDDEWSTIKKSYFKKVLVTHPDKGGNAEEFRLVQEAFETLRKLYETKRIRSFATSPDISLGDEEGIPRSTYSYEYYKEAAAENVAPYRVEKAKSARSSCNAKGQAKHCASKLIPKGSIRIGSMDPVSGTYCRFTHLGCWRVPSRIWLGLPNPEVCTDPTKFEDALIGMNEVSLCGFADLEKELRLEIVEYVMDKSNWARLSRRKAAGKKPIAIESSLDYDGSTQVKSENQELSLYDAENHTASSSTALARQEPLKERFVVPIPNDTTERSLEGKRCVLTGTFPEVGGGAGLNLGKDRVKAMLESFGAKVTSAISGKTDMLVVGQQPGAAKVSKARLSGLRMLDLDGVKKLAEGKLIEGAEDDKPMIIESFSGGYWGNAIALDGDDLLIAQGKMSPPKQIAGPKRKAGDKPKPTAVKRPSRKRRRAD